MYSFCCFSETAGYNLIKSIVCFIEPYLEQENVLVTLCDSADDKYRFGFNGMEKDNELKGVGNSLDFRERIYDSKLGRFLSVDTLTAQYPFYKPYY